MMCLGLVLGILAGSHAVVGASGVPPPPVRPRQWYSPDPGNAQTPTPKECVEISFTEPAWGIYDPALTSVNASSGGTQGDIRFLAVNSATGVQATCRAQNIELDPTGAQLEVWQNCSVPGLQFQFILSLFEVKLRGTWSCDNSSVGLSFVASGSWEEPIVQGCLDEWNTPRGQETLCIMGGSHVAASLSSPVPIKPQAPYLPFTPTERSWRCVDRSWDPEWQVNDLAYRYDPSGSSYEVSLNVTNLSSEQAAACSAAVSKKDLPANGSSNWVDCLFANGTVALELLPEPAYGVLGLKQNWSCWDGVEGVEAANYTGVLFLTPPALTCSPDRTCTLPPASFPFLQTGYADQAPRMPHTSYARSCTINSISNLTSLTLASYDTSAGNFTLTNPGSGDTYELTNVPVSADGEWHSCLAGDRVPWQLVGCRLNVGKEGIKFEVQWYCDDREPSNAILFTAVAQTQTPLSAGQGRDLVLSVKNLTWEAGKGIMDRGPTLPWI